MRRPVQPRARGWQPGLTPRQMLLLSGLVLALLVPVALQGARLLGWYPQSPRGLWRGQAPVEGQLGGDHGPQASPPISPPPEPPPSTPEETRALEAGTLVSGVLMPGQRVDYSLLVEERSLHRFDVENADGRSSSPSLLLLIDDEELLRVDPDLRHRHQSHLLRELVPGRYTLRVIHPAEMRRPGAVEYRLVLSPGDEPPAGWERGPALPRTWVSQITVGGGRHADEVEAVFESIRPELDRCFQLARGTGGSSRVRLSMVVRPTGGTEARRLPRQGGGAESLRRCVDGALGGLRFPRALNETRSQVMATLSYSVFPPD